MTEPQTRHRIDASASDVIRRLPGMGKLMIIGKNGGATHERIGKVETVAEVSGRLVCGGAHHDSSIDPSLISEVIFDISSIMQDQVYPRLNFLKPDSTILFAAVGFEGLEPFASALSDLERTVDASMRDTSRPKRPELDPADPGNTPFNRALAHGAPITISYEEDGFRQSWTGPVSKVSPGMGFINVMSEDFHLHLLGGTVVHWQEVDAGNRKTKLSAINAKGEAIGLTLVVPATEPVA